MGNLSFQSQYQFGEKPSGTAPIPVKSKGKGCLGIIVAIVVFIIIIIGGIFFVYPALTPNSIRGDFMSMTIVPQKDGSQKLWILTDGSFRFIQTTKSPGSYSSGVKCYFCKTWTYIYDPVTKQILNKIKTEQQDIITKIDIFYHKGQVWQVTGEYGENEPKLDIFDAETSEKVIDTKAFINKYDILNAGISSIRYNEKEKTIYFNTKDGKEQVVYSIEEDTLYENVSEFSKVRKNFTEEVSIAILNPEASSSKKFKLYKVSGPKGKIESERSSLEFFVLDKNNKSLVTNGLDVQPTTNKGYLEGLLYYSDNDCGIIIYLDQIGRKANRFMTCIDLQSGSEKWTVGPDVLFKRMKIDEDKDSFSDLFFTKDKIKVRRSGNLVILEMQDEGMIGIDYETGKVLWQLDI